MFGTYNRSFRVCDFLFLKIRCLRYTKAYSSYNSKKKPDFQKQKVTYEKIAQFLTFFFFSDQNIAKKKSSAGYVKSRLGQDSPGLGPVFGACNDDYDGDFDGA